MEKNLKEIADHWYESGLLHGLNHEEDKEIVASALEKVSNLMLEDEAYLTENLIKQFEIVYGYTPELEIFERFETIILPIIRRIFSTFRENYIFDEESRKKVMSELNFQKIILEIVNAWEIMSTPLKLTFKKLDFEAVVTSLFCENFVAEKDEERRKQLETLKETTS